MKTLTLQFIRELDSEARATRACLERFDEKFYDFKPHEKSMGMGYLATVTADIPRWITTAVEKGVINFGTWEKVEPRTGKELADHFDKVLKDAKELLSKTTDEQLEEDFFLKSGDNVLMKDSKRNLISSSINHMVHHRGQLTVYMRLNGIPVPSIYGPSADDKSF